MSVDLPDADFRIHQLAGRHLPRLAAHTALISDEGSWSYAELDAMTDALAAFLRARACERATAC